MDTYMWIHNNSPPAVSAPAWDFTNQLQDGSCYEKHEEFLNRENTLILHVCSASVLYSALKCCCCFHHILKNFPKPHSLPRITNAVRREREEEKNQEGGQINRHLNGITGNWVTWQGEAGPVASYPWKTVLINIKLMF